MSREEREAADEAYWQACAHGADIHRPGFVRGKIGCLLVLAVLFAFGVFCIVGPFLHDDPDRYACLVPVGIGMLITCLGSLFEEQKNWDQGL